MKYILIFFLFLSCFCGCSSYDAMLDEYNGNFLVAYTSKRVPLIGDADFLQDEMIPFTSYQVRKGINFQLEAPGASASCGVTTYRWKLSDPDTGEVRLNTDFNKRLFVVQTKDSKLKKGVPYEITITATNPRGTYIDSTILVLY